MNNEDKLHPDEKDRLASKFPQLDAILKQRHDIQAEIRMLNGKIDELHKKDQQLDEQFHREAIAVIPTIVKKIPDKKRADKSQGDVLVRAILDNLDLKGPNVEDQLRQILARVKPE